ncbi:MAG TPA: hypothetical protein VND93_09595 [Myxococcales bacterium]|nr:hypothetical protein [Myxococcales bacterium]
MNLFQLVLEGVRQRGVVALCAWVGLMLVTWLVFDYGSSQPLAGRALVGAGFVYAVLVLGVSTVAARLKKPPPPPSPSSKKKRR